MLNTSELSANKLKLWIMCAIVLPTIFRVSALTADDDKIAFDVNSVAADAIQTENCILWFSKKCPDENIKFYLYTKDNAMDGQYIHIDETQQLSNLSASSYNPNDAVIILVHGYNVVAYKKSLLKIKDEYLQKGSFNVFYVDWNNYARVPCYPSAAINTRKCGTCTAQLINRIVETGQKNIHFIGFSLGAHVANFAAKQLVSYRLPRITGLDPALPFFITANNDNKLDASDGEFVDVMHTNALVRGRVEQSGSVDFYMNGGVIQPGCPTALPNPSACSHVRVLQYFSESINSSVGFYGLRCGSFILYLLGLCPRIGKPVIAGENTPTSARGLYIVFTQSTAPYAAGNWEKPTKVFGLLGYGDLVDAPESSQQLNLHDYDLDYDYVNENLVSDIQTVTNYSSSNIDSDGIVIETA